MLMQSLTTHIVELRKKVEDQDKNIDNKIMYMTTQSTVFSLFQPDTDGTRVS